VVDVPAFKVIGKVAPTSDMPVPVTDAEEIVKADVPVDESVTDCVADDPTVTVPKLKLVVLSVSLGFVVAVPVPVSPIVVDEPFVELLLTVNFPVREPAVTGANTTCTVNDWPVERVIGSVLAAIEKPVPETVVEFMVNGELPVEESVTDMVFVVPSAMLPKFREVGAIAICVDVVTPVPERATVDVAPVVELLPTVRPPVTEPAAFGVNVMGIARD